MFNSGDKIFPARDPRPVRDTSDVVPLRHNCEVKSCGMRAGGSVKSLGKEVWLCPTHMKVLDG